MNLLNKIDRQIELLRASTDLVPLIKKAQREGNDFNLRHWTGLYQLIIEELNALHNQPVQEESLTDAQIENMFDTTNTTMRVDSNGNFFDKLLNGE